MKTPFQALTCPRRVTGTYKIVDWQKYQSRWPHLSVCKFPDPAADPMVDLLNGRDQIDLHFSKCDVKGDPGEPVARLGPLGWSYIGHPDRRTIAKEMQTNLVYTLFCRPRMFDEINDSLNRFWEIETLGTQKSKPYIMSVEEKIAFEKVNQSLVHDVERYQVAASWKSDCPTLPNNFEMACSRLKNTEKRLLRQPTVGQEYNQIIVSYLDKGYIHKIKETDKEPPIVSYLPHFPVCRPERMTAKTRIVFDASAKFQGTSLNEELYEGPKLQNSLFDVLLRFRRFPVAVACDVSEMYLQIRIPIEDRSKFRLLWRNLEVDRKPDIYEFERVVFGDASGPFRAQYVSQENARIYQKEFPHASTTVCKSTYLDDSLDSVRDNQTAIQLFEELQRLWAKAGMKTRKWLSNSSEVLTKIHQELRAYEINLKDSLPTAKTLGILWQAQQDVLTFQAKKLPEEEKLTKRIILSKVAGGFDPLGLAGPFVVCAKNLLQKMWTKGLDWDKPIDHELSSRQVIGKHSSRQVIEKHGVGNMNSNGLMVLEFCSRYQLRVMGTMFQMKNSLKTTWQHLRSKRFHQIDHVLANTRAKQYINVTKIYPNADCFTDYKLLTSNCIFRIQRKKKGLKPPKKFDITLTSEKIQRLQLFLDEKLPDCRHDWEDFKMTLQDAAKHTFDQKKKVSNDWFDDQDEEIQRLLKDKQLNRNELLRDRVRLQKNQRFHERATEATTSKKDPSHQVERLCE